MDDFSVVYRLSAFSVRRFGQVSEAFRIGWLAYLGVENWGHWVGDESADGM